MSWDILLIALLIFVLLVATLLYARFYVTQNLDEPTDEDTKTASAEEIIEGGYRKKRTRVRKDRIKDLTISPRSKSEANVIKHLEAITGAKFPTVYPAWLVSNGSPMELDGYNDKLKIGLEFSGPLHTKWSPQTEDYYKYYDRIVKDRMKRRICKAHGVYLIVIDMSLPVDKQKDYLKSRLWDYEQSKKKVKDLSSVEKPWFYIDKQRAKVYRNEQLERELGLNSRI